MKYLVPKLCILLAVPLFVMGVLEIAFPDIFSLADKFEAWKYYLHIGIAETVLSALLIIPAWKIDKAWTGRVLEILIRVGIGGMFIFASTDKIASPKAFAVLVAQYRFLPENIVNLWALILPQLEFWFGLALIASPFTKECTLAILAMFSCFIIALIWALALELDIVCGCFSTEMVSGAQSKSEAWVALIRDLVLLGPTIWLLTRKNKWIWQKN
ncbi:MAG: hypothetical protein FWC26_05825 [Fibromonadales bacterium]|nr:hypothetical protein [Fibromonadales bacterium]